MDAATRDGNALRYVLRYDLSLTSLYRAGYEREMEHHYTDAIVFTIEYVWCLKEDSV